MKNKTYLLSILFVLVMSLFFFFDYIKNSDISRKSFKQYDLIKENCQNKKNINSKECMYFKNEDGKIDEHRLNDFLLEHNPYEKKKQLDAISISSQVIILGKFHLFQAILPILIIFIIVCENFDEFHSGNFINKLLREDYKQYLGKIYRKNIKYITILSTMFIFIILISMFYTKFNFNIPSIDTTLAYYGKFRYQHFIIYELIILLLQALLSIFYINISFYSILKHKNKIVSIVMGYIYYLIYYITMSIGSGLIFYRLLGIEGLSDYFNFANFHFFNESSIKFSLSFVCTALLIAVSFIILYLSCNKKEKVLKQYEN